MFLEHLSDSLDDQGMKVAVIKLVIACLEEQSSMTAAFFDISVAGETSGFSILESIQVFLKNVEKVCVDNYFIYNRMRNINFYFLLLES